MAYDARQVANWFVRQSNAEGRNLSIMSLLKLTYIAHGWHLEMYESPLIENEVQAWQYGPVIPDVYSTFRRQGIEIASEITQFPPNLDKKTERLLEQIWKIYGQMSAYKLSDITHEQGGPWHIASMAGNYAKIPNELIQKHYKMKRLQSNQQQNA